MKKIISILLAVLLLASPGTSVLADNGYEIPEMGMTLHDVSALYDIKGVVEIYPYGQISEVPDIYYMPVYYFAVEQDVFNELNNRDPDQVTDEEISAVLDRQGVLGEILAADCSADELAAFFALDDSIAAALEEFGSADGYTFYYLSGADDVYLELIGEEYAADFTAGEAVLREILAGADLYDPMLPGEELIGSRVSFETVDTDGSTVTSEELFGGNKVTMVNYWGTWCHFCVEEMAELAEIHTRLQEKGCGVIGVLQDGNTPEGLALAKQIMTEKGTNYPNVLLSADMDFLASVTSFPTTFFVDSDGVILCEPVVGQALDEYERVVDELLAGEEASVPASSEAGANGADAYRVFVTDADGAPVEGVMLQICDDTSCTMGNTGADGSASFDLPEGSVYAVHVLKVPEGYAMTDAEFQTLDVFSDVFITLDPAA